MQPSGPVHRRAELEVSNRAPWWRGGCRSRIDAGPEVHPAVEFLLRGARVAASHVGAIDEVARLLAIAVDQASFSGHQFLAEDCDDARFSVRVLPRAVHVGVPQSDVLEGILRAVVAEIELARGLRDAIGRNRSRRVIFPGWVHVLFPVDRPSGGAQHELLYSPLVS